MPRMFESLCTLDGPKTSHAHAHRGEALQMLAVLQGIFPVWQFADTFAYSFQRVAAN